MERKDLPRLELDGFKSLSNEKNQKTTFSADAGNIPEDTSENPPKPLYHRWREKAANLARRAGIPAKSKKVRNEDEMDVGYKRLLIKTGACAVIAILILIISSINTPAAVNFTGAVSETLNQEFDIDDDIGRLKFVQNLEDDVQKVMSVLPETAVVYPADGDVITAFGQSGTKGARLSAADGKIYNIAKGTVTAVGKISGLGYVKIKLDAGETVAYYYIEPSVQVDDIVMPGQTVGTLSGDYVYIEMKKGEEYIDPLQYVEERSSQVVQ